MEVIAIHPIKSVYNFLVTTQILCLIVFMFYLIESNLDLVIPITMNIDIPVPLASDIHLRFSYNLHFNIVTLIGLLIAITLIYLITSITVVGSGVTDSGTISIKEIISFLVKYGILNLPVTFIFSQSDLLNSYIPFISLFSLIIYVLNFMVDSGGDKE